MAPTLPITFDQEAASDDRKLVHLSALHPLVRQAARHLLPDNPQFCALRVETNTAPAGNYPFAIYQWTKHGVREDELLAAVSENLEVEDVLLSLLPRASSSSEALPEQSVFDALDDRHHARWARAQAQHIAENRQMVEHRVQSLTASHSARVHVIQDQIDRTTNEKIRIMRNAELARATADYQRRIERLNDAAESGDIRTNPIVFGLLEIASAEQ